MVALGNELSKGEEVNRDEREEEGERVEEADRPAELGLVGRNCKTCGCPPERAPMIFRNTGWCSENHRKQQQEER